MASTGWRGYQSFTQGDNRGFYRQDRHILHRGKQNLYRLEGYRVFGIQEGHTSILEVCRKSGGF